METDVPKDWNRERGGLSRNHKGFQGKSGRTERVRARQRAAGRGCSEAGRGKKWGKKVAGRGGGGGRGVREESGAGRGTPGLGRGTPAGAATRADRRREAERERLKVPRPCSGPGGPRAAGGRSEAELGSLKPETSRPGRGAARLAGRKRRGGGRALSCRGASVSTGREEERRAGRGGMGCPGMERR